jgi:hypothetical protein
MDSDEPRTALDSAPEDSAPEDSAPEDSAPEDSASRLDARAAAILAFEAQWWKHPGAKEQAIRERFEMSPNRYYQVLNALIDRPAALAQDPVLVARLRRLRQSRQRLRSTPGTP